MTPVDQPPARPGFPPSPCINNCTLDDESVCLGCHRTIGEIIDWSRMSAAQQWQVIHALPARRASRLRAE
ncbi:MAG TPA: DUF1289 domain-containing protein [Woeseiaceae bacterium]|nr:DUF1289 domain-containing protein [Woeseiaceae bacterium]